MKFWQKLFILSFLICANSYAGTNLTQIKKINFNQNEVEIILDNKVKFQTYVLNNPDRLVVDLEGAELKKEIVPEQFPDFILGLRNSKKINADKKTDLRIVFDFKQKISIKNAAYIKLKNNQFGKIIIKFDLQVAASNAQNLSDFIAQVTDEKNPAVKYIAKQDGEEDVKTRRKSPIVVIDAGHGGKDPGTIGDYARTKEKNITLSYAKELAKHLNNTGRYKAYLTRDFDIFLPLKDRVNKARRLNADLFISLHVNSAMDNHVSGFSIYTLSEKSSDKQAEMLAQKENRADIISGINFSDANGDVLKALIDLSQRSSMNDSSRFANIAIKEVQKYDVDILQNTHRFAGFMVLTAPDMVSILIELGYLSNPSEEKKLNSLIHKRNIVKGLAEAIDEYFKFNYKK